MTEVSSRAIRKWNRAAPFMSSNERSEEIRYGAYKRDVFRKATGSTLLVAVGTGADLKYFPAGIELTGIDFAPRMLHFARERTSECASPVKLIEADVTHLEFEDASFDTVATSCTFCSVPDPLAGLREVHRVLKPDGRLLMFEHVRPGIAWLGLMMDLMNPLARWVGPEVNRRTVDTVRVAGFRITREFNVFLDMVKLLEAEKG